VSEGKSDMESILGENDNEINPDKEDLNIS